MVTIDSYIASIMPQFREQLAALVSIPSVSNDGNKLNPAVTLDSEKKENLRQVLRKAAEIASEAGFTTEIVEAPGNPPVHNPVLVGTLEVDAKAPWVLVYNHLDVQPADEPEWKTKPFTPVISKDKIIGRGTTDDKGPALAVLHAIKYLHSEGRLPVNVQVVYETAEEIGSGGFDEFLFNQFLAEDGASKIRRPDSILVSDTIFEGEHPAITYALRGLVKAEVSITTAATTLHSGILGGYARNPLTILTGALARCVDPVTGRVFIRGFYDTALPVSEEERKALARIPFDMEKFTNDAGARVVYGCSPVEALARMWREPTFEIHTYEGGVKGTKIPYYAAADVSMRLVAGQDPDSMARKLARHLKNYDPLLEVKITSASRAVQTNINVPHMKRAAAACTEAFGKEALFVACGGSIGSMPPLQHLFPQAPLVLMAMSKVSDGYHAPNEQFEFRQAELGIKAVAKYLSSIGDLKTQ